MKKLHFAVIMAVVASGSYAHAADLFSAFNGTLSTQTTDHYMEEVTISAPSVLTGVTVSLNLGSAIAAGTPEHLLFKIWSGASSSPASTDALAGQTLLYTSNYYDVSGANTPDPNTVFFLPLQVPFALATTTFAVEITLLNNALTDYSAPLSGNFSTGADATVGSNTLSTLVWSDYDFDGKFENGAHTTQGTPQPAELTNLGAAPANVRFSLQTVPEPSTYAIAGLGSAVLFLALRRKKALQ